MNITSRIIFIAIISSILALVIGCSKKLVITGFLTDYSRLEPEDGSLRYIDMQRLGSYSKFIIEPVRVLLYKERQDSPDRATQTALANYMHNAIVNALGDRYMIVSQPGPGVARVSIAITDIEMSTPVFNVLPQTRLSGEALGGVSMEAEVLDSQTWEQIGALIESKKGSPVSLSGLKKWDDVKPVMDEWAKRFRKRLDEAHGY